MGVDRQVLKGSEASDSAPRVARGPGTGMPSLGTSPLSPQTVLRIQQAAGNRAAARMVARVSDQHGLTGGLNPDAPEPEEIDETTEPIGGLTAVAEHSAPALARQGAPAQARPGVDISVLRQSGPTWGANGAFDWRVSLRTTGRSGWIVQEVTNTINVQDSAGNTVNTSAVEPRYWEAWAVDGSGRITPSAGKVHDMWIRPSRGAGTKGVWSMSGRLHFTKTDPATQGFSAGGVSNAGILPATTTQPTGLGRTLRWRFARGSWDDTQTPARAHTGRAL